MPVSPFPDVADRPDLPAQEHAILQLWRERGTFGRLRARLSGGPRWSFLDGPITANNPMAVHHAWGRTYKDVFQRFHAMLGEDQRFQNGFDCQGLWVEVNVERDLGFTSKRDIERFGIAEFVNLCKQRVLTYAALQTEQSIRLGMWMDWNDPAELRRLRDLLAEDPSRVTTIEGTDGPVTDSVEMLVGRLGMRDVGGSYFTFSNENNDLIWAFLAECHARGWLYKGHDSMPWCPRCGTGISQMEMNEGYHDREDPGLTVKLPLLERPGESLLVWTTTPWTLTSNVAAAVGEDITYAKVRQDGETYWLGKGTLRTALRPGFTVLEERPGRDLVGWPYAGPFDDLPAVREAFAGAGEAPGVDYVHRVVPWGDVTEVEGTGIVHIAPGCGAEDFALGKALGLPVIAPLDENGRYVGGFAWLTGEDVQGVTERIVDELRRTGAFYRLETYVHRYPHCWRCDTPLVFRVVDEWYISMGPVYEEPRERLTPDQKERSLRYQIMDVVDTIRWIPGFGYERELDWLRTMGDWMISKKRYWGLALPIWECSDCGSFEVMSGREALRERAVAGWDGFEGHTPHRPWVDAVRIRCAGCGGSSSRITDVGTPWLDAGIVPFSTLHYREDPEYWARWFPADFITESFPGQFRNWFYSMLAMSTVLRGEAPFRTILGYMTLFAEDGRPMHKSTGNAIDFDEAAERIGVDVMRWMYAKQRLEENILFGYTTADDARRELLVLWNVFAFFCRYARLAGWHPDEAELRRGPDGPDVAADRTVFDRWILSRTASLAQEAGVALRDFDARAASLRIARHIEELSTWYLRRSRRRFSRNDDPDDRAAAFSTLHAALALLARIAAPILPFLAEHLHQALIADVIDGAPDSVHLTRWPDEDLAGEREEALERDMATVLRAVELGRAIRDEAGIRLRQPLARLWLAVPGGRLGTELSEGSAEELRAALADELNVKAIELMSDDSDLVDRRVKPLLPVIGKRLGPQVPAVMAAARAGDLEIRPDGSVELAGVVLQPHEVEIQAVARPGTAVASDEGIVVVIDTTLTPELRAEGDAREVQRAIQDLRKTARLALDDRIVVSVTGGPDAVGGLAPYLDAIAAETLADAILLGDARAGEATATVRLSDAAVTLALRRSTSGAPPGPAHDAPQPAEVAG